MFPLAISYGGFFPSEASTSVLADEPMPMMPASLSQAVGPQTTLPLVHPPTSRIAPPWGKGDPPISVTGVLPRPLGKTRAGGNMWQHMCSLKSPEFKDALLIARAKKGTSDEHGCQSQHVSNFNSSSVKHLSLFPSPTASSQPTLPRSIHHLSSIIHHQWQLPISSLLNHHLDFPDIQ